MGILVFWDTTLTLFLAEIACHVRVWLLWLRARGQPTNVRIGMTKQVYMHWLFYIVPGEMFQKFQSHFDMHGYDDGRVFINCCCIIYLSRAVVTEIRHHLIYITAFLHMSTSYIETQHACFLRGILT